MILSLIIFLPLISSLLIPLKYKNRNLFYLLLLIVTFFHLYLTSSIAIKTHYTFLFLTFDIDVYWAKIFLMLISWSWIIASIYTFDFNKYNFQNKVPLFFLYLNTLLTIILLNVCAGDLITFFIFYTIGIPLTYFLVIINGGDEIKKAGSQFLVQLLAPVLFLVVPAIVLTYKIIGDVSFDSSVTFQTKEVNPYLGTVVLVLFIFGLSKNSIFPFHTWLPKIHKAPAPVSALIHSVVGVNTASIACIKLAVFIFGLDYLHTLTTHFITGGFIIYISGGTAVYAAYKALKTFDMKQRFIYSTVSQLSYIILGVLLGTQTGIIAATLHIVTHGIAKPCLFYVAGFFNSLYFKTDVREIGKVMPSHRFLAFVIAVCGLSISGFPLMAGWYSKDMMLIEDWNTKNYASACFLLVGSFINILYIYPVARNAMNPIDKSLKTYKVPKGMMVTFVISVFLVLTSSFYVSYLIEMLRKVY